MVLLMLEVRLAETGRAQATARFRVCADHSRGLFGCGVLRAYPLVNVVCLARGCRYKGDPTGHCAELGVVCICSPSILGRDTVACSCRMISNTPAAVVVAL